MCRDVQEREPAFHAVIPMGSSLPGRFSPELQYLCSLFSSLTWGDGSSEKNPPRACLEDKFLRFLIHLCITACVERCPVLVPPDSVCAELVSLPKRAQRADIGQSGSRPALGREGDLLPIPCLGFLRDLMQSCRDWECLGGAGEVQLFSVTSARGALEPPVLLLLGSSPGDASGDGSVLG